MFVCFVFSTGAMSDEHKNREKFRIKFLVNFLCEDEFVAYVYKKWLANLANHSISVKITDPGQKTYEVQLSF